MEFFKEPIKLEIELSRKKAFIALGVLTAFILYFAVCGVDAGKWSNVFSAMAGIGACLAALATWCAVVVARKALDTWREEHITKTQWELATKMLSILSRIESAGIGILNTGMGHEATAEMAINFQINGRLISSSAAQIKIVSKRIDDLVAARDDFFCASHSVEAIFGEEALELMKRLGGLIDDIYIAGCYLVAMDCNVEKSWENEGDNFRTMFPKPNNGNTAFTDKFNLHMEALNGYWRDIIKVLNK